MYPTAITEPMMAKPVSTPPTQPPSSPSIIQVREPAAVCVVEVRRSLATFIIQDPAA